MKRQIGPLEVEYVPGGVLLSLPDQEGEPLFLTLSQWESWLAGIKAGEFDGPEERS